MLDPANPGAIVIGDQTYPLMVPSRSESGLKLNATIALVPGQQTSMVIDFDASKSIIQAGKKYLLKPVLSIKSVVVGP